MKQVRLLYTLIILLTVTPADAGIKLSFSAKDGRIEVPEFKTVQQAEAFGRIAAGNEQYFKALKREYNKVTSSMHGGSRSDKLEKMRRINNRRDMIEYINEFIRNGTLEDYANIMYTHRDILHRYGVFFPHVKRRKGEPRKWETQSVVRMHSHVYLLFGFKQPNSEVEEYTILNSPAFEKNRRDALRENHPDVAGDDLAAKFWFNLVNDASDAVANRKFILQKKVDLGRTLSEHSEFIPRDIQDLLWVDVENSGLFIGINKRKMETSAVKFKSMRQATLWGIRNYKDKEAIEQMRELWRNARKEADRGSYEAGQVSDMYLEAIRTAEDPDIQDEMKELEIHDKFEHDVLVKRAFDVAEEKINRVGADVYTYMRPLYNKGVFWRGVYYP